MAKFITELKAPLKSGAEDIYVLEEPLVYESDILGPLVVPAGFETDLASVPRVPIIYMLWGNRAHREAVLHDYLYRIDSVPEATITQANDVFFEAMQCRSKPWYVCYPMWMGVAIGGDSSYHKRNVGDRL